MMNVLVLWVRCIVRSQALVDNLRLGNAGADACTAWQGCSNVLMCSNRNIFPWMQMVAKIKMGTSPQLDNAIQLIADYSIWWLLSYMSNSRHRERRAVVFWAGNPIQRFLHWNSLMEDWCVLNSYAGKRDFVADADRLLEYCPSNYLLSSFELNQIMKRGIPDIIAHNDGDGVDDTSPLKRANTRSQN